MSFLVPANLVHIPFKRKCLVNILLNLPINQDSQAYRINMINRIVQNYISVLQHYTSPCSANVVDDDALYRLYNCYKLNHTTNYCRFAAQLLETRFKISFDKQCKAIRYDICCFAYKILSTSPSATIAKQVQ